MNKYISKKIKDKKKAVVWLENQEQKDLTYGELGSVIVRRVHLFESKGIQRHQTIAVLATRGPEYLINMLALWHIGATYMPLSDDWHPDEIRKKLKKANADFLITTKNSFHRFKESKIFSDISYCILELSKFESDGIRLSHACEVEESDIAFVVTSSGTTGEPKCIEVTHEAISDRIESHIEIMKITSGENLLGFIDFGWELHKMVHCHK